MKTFYVYIKDPEIRYDSLHADTYIIGNSGDVIFYKNTSEVVASYAARYWLKILEVKE